MSGVRRAGPPLAAAVLATLAGCGGGAGAAAAPTAGVVVPSVNPFASPSPTPTMPPPVAVGQPMTNGDFTLTVTSARVVESEEMRQPGPTLGSATGPFLPTRPPVGTKFIDVRTHLVNGATEGVDVSCEVVLYTQLVDDRGTLYDDREAEPDLLPGNPPCHVDLPPGGQEDVTWLYDVPTSAHIVAWRFGDFRSWSGRRAPATVEVDL